MFCYIVDGLRSQARPGLSLTILIVPMTKRHRRLDGFLRVVLTKPRRVDKQRHKIKSLGSPPWKKCVYFRSSLSLSCMPILFLSCYQRRSSVSETT